jgi:hypothetical protein
MLYFNLKPNYARIKKYFPWEGTPEQLQEANPDGYRIEVEFWQTDDQFHKVFNRFGEIVEAYNLQEWCDDILLLLLLKYKTIEESIYDLELDYANRKRAKELAKFLLIAKETPKNKYNKLSIATLTDTAKVSDPEIISWISQLITGAIEKGHYPISLLGLAASDMYIVGGISDKELNVEKLQSAAAARITTVSKLTKERQADLCLFIYKYMVDETGIKPTSDQWFSAKLLNFYFDVLEMFDYVDRLAIESEPNDWIRTFLMNRLKELNPSLSGK